MKNMNEYKYHCALKLRIYPSNLQKLIIKKCSDTSRFVYNKMVAIGNELYNLKKIQLFDNPLVDRLKYLEKLKKSTTLLGTMNPWMADKHIDSLAVANAKQNYRKAWSLFKKIGSSVPTFHKKSYEEKYQTNLKCLFTKVTNILTLPKLGKIKFSGSKKILAKLHSNEGIRMGTVTITKTSEDKYYASVALASDKPFWDHIPKTCKDIGIDLNVKNFLTDSDGNIVDNPKYYKKSRKKLAKVQRAMARKMRRAKKKKVSLRNCKNYQNARKKASSISRKVMNQRNDFLHNLSYTLIKNHDMVYAEDLKSKEMLQGNYFASSISDCGWNIFLDMLEYKAKIYGKIFQRIDPFRTTQTCSNCGHVMSGEQKLKPTDRSWDCPSCKIHHDRDHNAAKNILGIGRKIFRLRWRLRSIMANLIDGIHHLGKQFAVPFGKLGNLSPSR